MKKDTHPTYYPEARVKCACGNEFAIGSTRKEIEVEACGQCHPFYTGKERGAVRGGRVEKFQERIKKQSKYQKKTDKKARKREKQAEKTEKGQK